MILRNAEILVRNLCVQHSFINSAVPFIVSAVLSTARAQRGLNTEGQPYSKQLNIHKSQTEKEECIQRLVSGLFVLFGFWQYWALNSGTHACQTSVLLMNYYP